MNTGGLLNALVSVGLVANASTAAVSATPDLDRKVAAQWAIEEVYWRHRLWPADNQGPKPDLRRVLSQEVVRQKVVDAQLRAEALERFWGRRIDSADLQDEVQRMVATTRAPGVLKELFDALGNDPDVVAECLALPALTERWIRHLYEHDARLHGGLRAEVEQAMRRFAAPSDLRSLGGRYSEQILVLGEPSHGLSARVVDGVRARSVDRKEWNAVLARLEEGRAPSTASPVPHSATTPSEEGTPARDPLPIGVPGAIQEDEGRFFVQAILEKDARRLRVATVSWPKRSFDDWWSEARTALVTGSPLAVQPDRGLADRIASPQLDASAAAVSDPDGPGYGCTVDTWSATSLTSAPAARSAPTAVWTGAEMVVWGGWTSVAEFNTGGRYDPATNTWTPTSTAGAPTARDSHTAVWSGSQMIVWGGSDENSFYQDTGGRYDPVGNTWTATSTTGAPTARAFHTAVWTGTKMVVWGGLDDTGDVRTGGLYDPSRNTWSATTVSGVPTARDSHSAVWTSSRMVIWGGVDDTFTPLQTGGRYDPVGNSWQSTTTTGAPTARAYHTAVWTGTTMVIWGGWDGSARLNTGGRYDPGTDQWLATSTTGAPTARELHTGVWSNSGMIVWGGRDNSLNYLSSGARYDPSANGWTPTPSANAPSPRAFHAAVWTDAEMVIWGGTNGLSHFATGGEYCAGTCTSTPPSGIPSVSMSQEAGGSRVRWTTVATATGYDVVRGSVGTLRSTAGDFTSATNACLANDTAELSVLDANIPAAANGFWYLARGMNCGGSGTYDGPGGRQSGSRDAEIDAAASRCP